MPLANVNFSGSLLPEELPFRLHPDVEFDFDYFQPWYPTQEQERSRGRAPESEQNFQSYVFRCSDTRKVGRKGRSQPLTIRYSTCVYS